MRSMIIKLFLLGLIFFISKARALSQDIGIECDISSVDFNLSGSHPDYLVKLGSFSMFEDGVINKFYKLPRTKLILSVSVVHYPKHELTPSEDVLMMLMALGKKKISFFSDFLEDEKMVKDTINLAQTGYPIELFDKGGKGVLSTAFFGKKKPIQIAMKCKKAGS